MKFDNKTILLTGASSGIGKAVAEELSKRNCNILLVARRIELLEELKASLKQNPANIEIYKCNVADKNEVANAYKLINEKYNFIDVAILNSGVGIRENIEEYNSENAEEIFGVNVFGIIYWVEQLLKDFLPQKKGMIVGVSSLADSRGFSGSGFYCASKSAATKYLEGLAVELSSYNVKVITVRPGFVKTPMTDKNEFKMPWLMSPEKAADTIIKGIEKEKRYIQFPFQTYLLTRIVGMIPNKVYEYIAKIDYENRRKNK